MPQAQGKLQTEFKTSENLAVYHEALRNEVFYISAQKWLDVLPFYFVQLTVLTDYKLCTRKKLMQSAGELNSAIHSARLIFADG